MSKTITVQIKVPDDRKEYVEANARVRNISETQMMRKVMDFVVKDQMILGILDDADKPSLKTAPIRNTRGMGVVSTRKHATTTRPATPALIPQRPNAQTINFRKPQHKTRAELQEELRQAVLNTAGLPVE